MEESQRTQVILSAVTATGPRSEGESRAEWVARVASMAAGITAMCSDRSPLAKVVEQVERSKVFQATVLGVTKEQSSTRGIVRLRTSPSQFHPDGVEEARTERTDTPIGLAMARMIRSELVGHRVTVWVEVEQINGGAGKVRVIRHIEDLGMARDAEDSPKLSVVSE